ncbi:hypothetical protein AWB69_03480 [Caballeronia udeis]|uniref:Uncharacterized protein n=1 Tax=Caballeronia udeis TaxID=1232866 RepID=A0A158GY53_9BURK|nr:hypothetical protein AWB69_03480 [Caballeronia udeis]
MKWTRRLPCEDTDGRQPDVWPRQAPAAVVSSLSTPDKRHLASQIAVRRHGERLDMRESGRLLRTFPQQVCHMLGLSDEQFQSEAFSLTFNSLMNHFANRLGIEPADTLSARRYARHGTRGITLRENNREGPAAQ